MLGGENVRELLGMGVYVGQQFLKRNSGVMRVGESHLLLGLHLVRHPLP